MVLPEPQELPARHAAYGDEGKARLIQPGAFERALHLVWERREISTEELGLT